MKQMSLASGFELATKRTRKRVFLDEMHNVMPWSDLLALIATHAPEGKMGRPPIDTEVMLRIHLLQQFFGNSDLAMEEALHDVALYRQFARLDAGKSRLPYESTILRFGKTTSQRHLLLEKELGQKILDAGNAQLVDRGLLLKTATVVDATLISAPSSTKNSTGERDPEMYQTKKGKQRYHGMKAHIGVDAESGHQVSVWAPQDALPWFGQKHQAAAGDVCTVELVYGAKANIAGATGTSAPAARAKTRKQPPDGGKRA